MKICQICAVDFTLYHFLLPLMEASRAAGHEVVGVSNTGPLIEKVRDRGLRVETIPFARSANPFRNLSALMALISLFRRERFDLIHVHTPVAALLGRLAARLSGAPRIVYTAHGFFFHDRMPWPKRWLFIAFEWLGGRLTHTLFTQAEEDAHTARRLHLCRTGDILAIGNGSDPRRFNPSVSPPHRARTRHALALSDKDVVIVMVGRLVAEKGHPELIEAMRRVKAALWIVGERLPSDHADDISALLETIQHDPDLGPRVQLLGYRSDIPDLLRAADIFVLPSHREGMPRSIIEAMLSGLPVVATDIRGCREEVVDGETGFLIPPRQPSALAHALQRLVEDPKLRIKLGDAGRMRALKLFDEDMVIRRQLAHLGLVA